MDFVLIHQPLVLGSSFSAHTIKDEEEWALGDTVTVAGARLLNPELYTSMAKSEVSATVTRLPGGFSGTRHKNTAPAWTCFSIC